MRYLINMIAPTLVALAIGLGSFSASAAGVCGPHEKIVQQLEDGYKEIRSGYGLAGNGSLVELFVSKSTGSWTVMLTRPDGWTCLMATGGNWANLPAIEKAAEELM
ncbi:hypothetical protein [Curvivirga sp.]|uniref:hypothetical protein n=1 Tax=Curvivirga sp. TaxID=2856848 RepID=UPI003B5B4938